VATGTSISLNIPGNNTKL